MNASQVLRKYHGDQSYPIDVLSIAKQAGASVIFCDLSGLAGEFILENTDQPIIKINANDIDVRQRFTLAHELGHMFLEHGSRHRKDGNSNFNVLGDPIEMQANSFAAELLMPIEFINHMLYKLKITNVARMAKEFNVSAAAMHYRLKNLRII